ncbi:hypothetical protein FCU94_14975 [Vibrio sp. JPW-9-11-11]|uniref:COG3650 family protein n=1 Tax=Vibrio sp. JPW-9-11-11 TaxID=1416532 RepID=UPI0015948CC4|nr:hypothetical protein [Vibrio sp. JPW-9-11-11]NVD08180.1 hypothetical protein [Vibrio sp. JPW-9-11-11]
MKALRNPATLFTLLTLQACSLSTPTNSPNTEAERASLDVPSSIQAQPFVMRGEIVLGHEVRSITPCGSKKQYWLELSNDRFQQGLKLVRSPYQPLYGEVIGHLETGKTDGFVADYSARFVVDSFNLLSAENPQRCAQAAQETRAFGTEPFWSLRLTDSQWVFAKMGEEQQPLELISRQISAHQHHYQFAEGELELNQRSCVDGMSDSLYSWSATLKLDDTSYQGCATLSNQDITQQWTGFYQATSTQTKQFSVFLDLNRDHSATTTYRYDNGQSDSVERGYWQQLNPQQVQVVMTHHQQQPLLSERIFTRQGEALTAEKEKVGAVVYDIADGGLRLFSRAQNQAEGTRSFSAQPLAANAIPSSAEYNPMVANALTTYFQQTNTPASGTRYRWLVYDLNGDGNNELLVQLDWCGSGGCTLLIFDNQAQTWRFNSRITQVTTPLSLGRNQHQGWQDLVFFVSGGGAIPNQHLLQFNGEQYPLNPSVAPVASYDDISTVQLFADGLTPQQEGATL